MGYKVIYFDEKGKFSHSNFSTVIEEETGKIFDCFHEKLFHLNECKYIMVESKKGYYVNDEVIILKSDGSSLTNIEIQKFESIFKNVQN